VCLASVLDFIRPVRLHSAPPVCENWLSKLARGEQTHSRRAQFRRGKFQRCESIMPLLKQVCLCTNFHSDLIFGFLISNFSCVFRSPTPESVSFPFKEFNVARKPVRIITENASCVDLNSEAARRILSNCASLLAAVAGGEPRGAPPSLQAAGRRRRRSGRAVPRAG
jgi:hypothetical protein